MEKLWLVRHLAFIQVMLETSLKIIPTGITKLTQSIIQFGLLQTKRSFSLSCLKYMYSIYWAVLIFKATDKKQQFLLVRDWCPIWMVILPYYSFIIKLYMWYGQLY